MLAGQSHLGGRRIGPVALKEAAKCNSKAQHNNLEGEERTWELWIADSSQKICRSATPGRAKETEPLFQEVECTLRQWQAKKQPWSRLHGLSPATRHLALAR
jgi:hypothetical protein